MGTVGIVIVSHSAKLAAGVQKLAQQMAQAPVPLAIAAGIDDPEHPLGTDAAQIQAAIESVYSEDGVVVLMDLGSAILSAELALEFLSAEQQSHVRLCAAPLVEGAIAAVVQAATGATLDQVVAEARGALAAKVEQLAAAEEPSAEEQTLQAEWVSRPHEVHLRVQNPLGIHARPAAKFVATANRFQSDITVRNLTRNSRRVNAKSINQVVTLGIAQGHEIAIAAQGLDADEALAVLQQLVMEQFGERPIHAPPFSAVPSGIRDRVVQAFHPPSTGRSIGSGQTYLRGIPACPGSAIGPAILYHPLVPEVSHWPAEDPQAEWHQLQMAIQMAQRQIQDAADTLEASAEHSDTSIFHAHLLYLTDPALLDKAHRLIFQHHRCAAAAWKATMDEMIASYQALDDVYLQARAVDVRDVGQRVLRLLVGGRGTSLTPPHPGILVASDLMPSDVAQLHPQQVLGICTAAGSATAHTAVIANMLGIPMVVSAGEALLEIMAGTALALNGQTGEIWVNPNASTRQAIFPVLSSTPADGAAAAITQDGYRVPLMANTLGTADARLALERGAEGVGLLRTELLYLDRLTAPTEDEQFEIYRAIAQVLGTHPLTIRTVDIGGDKPVPYMNLTPETNPFLGWRGIRQSLDSPKLLKTQLRAILRASPDHAIKVMFPMVASVEEIRGAKHILARSQAELQRAGIPFAPKIPLGVMVEVPAAVVMADQLAQEVDFFSIGTNDLSQYVMAADRTNPRVAPLANAFEPAVLRMIQQTVAAAHNAGIPVSVCGQIASDPLAIPILLGLGVDELSVNPPALASVKAAIATLRRDEAVAIAQAVLNLDSAAAVREYVTQHFKADRRDRP